jgi:serine/threonine-protein kinase
MLVGTLKYMSLEQLRGEKPAESWDLWALAIVAYEMVAGAYPFAGATVSDVHNSILAGRVIPLRTHLPEATLRARAKISSHIGYEPIYLARGFGVIV